MADAWGVGGWVKVVPFNDPRESVLRSCRSWWLDDGRNLAIERARTHGASIVCKPAGVDDRDAALALCGAQVSVARADFPEGRRDEVYWVDLVGCAVSNREGVRLGEVLRVEDHGAHPILVVGGAEGPERMIPFVDAWIDSVDAPGGRIVANWQPDY